MAGKQYANSTGLLDIPVPRWIAQDEVLFSFWGMTLLAVLKHGTIEMLRAGETLDTNGKALSLLIDGGLYAITNEGESREFMISFLRRGELLRPPSVEGLSVRFEAHTRSRVVTIPEASLQDFIREVAVAPRLLQTIELHLTQQYAAAVQTLKWRDKDRLQRVIQMLADHPTANDTRLGREIESSKQNIRRLAGVEKRSASRAFAVLVNSGLVAFYGYKRLFFTPENR